MRLGPMTVRDWRGSTPQMRDAVALIDELNQERRISTVEVLILLAGLLDLPMNVDKGTDLRHRIEHSLRFAKAAEPSSAANRR